MRRAISAILQPWKWTESALGFQAKAAFLIDAAATGRDHSSRLTLTVYENIGISSLE